MFAIDIEVQGITQDVREWHQWDGVREDMKGFDVSKERAQNGKKWRRKVKLEMVG